jgi:hypothetical protein
MRVLNGAITVISPWETPLATHWQPTVDNAGPATDEAQSGSVSDRTREAWFVEFDGLSEDDVRTRINRKFYDNQVAEFAREWLTHREALRLRHDMRGHQYLAERARDVATDASRLAQEANNTARAAVDAANAAQEAIKAVHREALAGAMTARLSVIIAVLALAAAAATVVFR